MNLRFDPATKGILLTHKGNWYRLPNCVMVEKPAINYPVGDKTPRVNNSGYIKIDHDKFNDFVKNNRIKHLHDGRRTIIIYFKKVEVEVVYASEKEDSYIKLTGKLPYYVLIGILNFINNE